MESRVTRNFILVTIFCLSLINTKFTCAQFSEEAGFFPIINFTPEDYNYAKPFNWDIVQDKRGVMYFGNDEGVLEYDGIRWKLYTVTNETAVQSLAIDKNDRIYVGAINEFGYLSPNNQGDLEYNSLSKYIDDSLKNFFEIRNIETTSNGVYFQSNSHIFFWDGNKIDYWLADEYYFHTSFLIKDYFVINQTGSGLHVIKNNKIVKIKNTPVFKDNSAVFSIIPFENDSYLVITKSDGFYKAHFDDEMTEINIEPFQKELKNLLKDYLLFNAVKIGKNTYSIGTWGSGLLIYQNGKIVQLITKKSGLGDEVITNQFLDKDNNLWLTLSDGITKIEINSPLTTFTEELGVDGTLQAITRYNEKLYLASERGLLLLLDEWSDPNKIYQQNKFKKIAKFEGGVWDLLNYKTQYEDLLLIATNEGIFEMDKNHQYKLIYRCYPWSMYQSRKNNDRVFIAKDDGIASLVRKNKQWVVEYEFPEITEEIFTVCEDEEYNLWLGGTVGMGILKIDHNSLNDFENISVTRFNAKNGLPQNCDFYLALYDHKILIGTDQGIFEQVEGTDSFRLSEQFPPELISSDRIITRIKPDDHENLWVTTFIKSDRIIEAGYIKPNSTGYKWIDTPFNTISKGDLFSIYFDESNIVWLGGSEGLYRYDPSVEKNYRKDFAALIRLNIIGEDSTIFFGSYFDKNGYISTIQPEVLKPTLKYRYNSLEFEFAAQNTEIEHPILFSYCLDGYDRKWSDWSEEAKRYYTNLNEGTYIFKVKAKNIYEHESEEASYEFIIKPPWYRTIVAYTLYVFLLIVLVYLIVTQYTKYLREIIRQKTKEIRLQKEIVEHKNEEIMDSIKYAQRIQRALLPPGEILVESNIEHFILFKPRDIVSGDFYWFRNIGDFNIIVAADCTGHGVPGAFVSMLGMAFLNEISVEIKEIKADEILNRLRSLVIKSLRQTGKEGESKDGMDIALYVIDRKNMKLQFAGANNPLIIIRKGEIVQVKGDRMPIGYHIVMDNFKNNEIDIEQDDMLYTFSDGYQDQFGGEDGSKFKIKKLKQLMTEIYEKPTEQQHEIFDNTIEEWKGTEEQIDDILLIGVRI